MPIPDGWTDNGSELHSRNGFKVVKGFRSHIINAHSWDGANEPLENENYPSEVQLHNLSLGKGSRQCFRDTVLWYTEHNGVVQEEELGFECKSLYDIVNSLQSELTKGGLYLITSVQSFMQDATSAFQTFSTGMTLINSQSSDTPNAIAPQLLNLINSLSSAVQKFQEDTASAGAPNPPTTVQPLSESSAKAAAQPESLELPG